MVARNIRGGVAADNDAAIHDVFAGLTRPPSFPGLRRIVATVDMIGWYHSYGLTEEEKQRFWAMTGKEPVSEKSDYGGWNVRIAHPHHHLDFFLEWTQQRDITINLVHIAFDLEGLDAGRARRRVRNQLLIAHAPNAKKFPMEEAARKEKRKRKLRYDEHGLVLSGDFYFKDFRQATDEDGRRIGSRRAIPARFGRVYLRGSNTLRIEPCFHGRANIEKHLPPLHSILDTDPRDIFVKHLRWRTYRPRLLARKIRAQAAATTWGKPMVGIWSQLLFSPHSYASRRMSITRPLDLDVAFVWS